MIEKSDIKLITGGGIGLDEVHFLDDLCASLSLQGVFIIGNAFGWSSFTFAFLQSSKVLALDAGIEGSDNLAGIELTNTIARLENLPVHCMYGRSPDDVMKTILENMDEPPSLVFIDGLHENKQLLEDFTAVFDVAPHATYLFHDIVACHMQTAFSQISAMIASTHYSRILWRTSSGMGLSIPKERLSDIQAIIEAYTDDDGYLDTIRIRWRLLSIQSRLGPLGKVAEKAHHKFNKSLQWLTNCWSGRGNPRRSLGC